MTVVTPMCLYCKRYRIRTATCDSFPKGIPENIIFEGDPHYVSLGGEPVFEPNDAKSAATVEKIWPKRSPSASSS